MRFVRTFLFHSTNPVSYTHLDVYKRQILSTATTIFFNVLYLVVLKWGINGYILAMISADTLSTLCLFYLAGLHRYLHLRGLDLRTSKEMLRYSIPLSPNSIFWWINLSLIHI